MVSVHKDLLGAPENRTNVIFVDDVNLPARDAFDSQPPVELLRQLVSTLSFLVGALKGQILKHHQCGYNVSYTFPEVW